MAHRADPAASLPRAAPIESGTATSPETRASTANVGTYHDTHADRTQASGQAAFDRLQGLVAEEMIAVNAEIRSRMSSDAAPLIPELAAHLIEAGGKRLRPVLTLAAAKLCGYEGSHHIRLAATVEFIHTATLLHDDVVDESDRRRGRETANILWGNKAPVLVGDFLFSRSFQLMVETENLRVLEILSNASAVIAEGEVLQLSLANRVTADDTQYMREIGRAHV